jgi:diguanylate cyclase (GGDEF)-like protein
LIDDVTGGQDEPKRPVVSRRRGLGKGLSAILPGAGADDDQRDRRDRLTDLPDRSVLEERFEDAMSRCREDGASLAVLVVALDGFSAVNESYGHSVGDAVLHDAAARLSAARRSSDTVARFAGDEFVLVCPFVASADFAGQMATQVLEDLSRPTSVEGTEVQLSASIGVVVTFPGDEAGAAQTLEILVGDASLAMRRAKEEGGASWKVFDPSMREDVVVRSQSRQDLRAALEGDGLVLEYETMVDLETGEVVGDSAMLGWRQLGPEVDQPQAPLDLVDEAGLAVPVGRWVLDQALSDLSRRHPGSGRPDHFRVWVKVAPSLVADPALVDIVDELTAKHGVPPSVLGLDIREPSAAALASTESTLNALEERDVIVALDDFGAGQSNLTLLQRLPFTSLKLAPDLVAALADDPGDATPGDERAESLSREAAALVRGLIELGRALGLTVVAQGVESDAQMTALRGLGCDYAQGPFILGDEVSARAPAVRVLEPRPEPDPVPHTEVHTEPDTETHVEPDTEERDETETGGDEPITVSAEAPPTTPTLTTPTPSPTPTPTPTPVSEAATEAAREDPPAVSNESAPAEVPEDPIPDQPDEPDPAPAGAAPDPPPPPVTESLWAPGTLAT